MMSKIQVDILSYEEFDAIDSYFECVTACSLGDEGVECVTKCVAKHLKGEVPQ